MSDPRSIAESVVGQVDWQDAVHGYCRCPGFDCHTKANRNSDCSIFLDSVPTITCYHGSCRAHVDATNRKLRGLFNGSNWSITLPGGKVLRNGDSLKKDGTIVKREVAQMQAMRDGIPKDEGIILAQIAAAFEKMKPDIFEWFYWPYDQIVQDSPIQCLHREPDHQFRTWLKIWPACSTVWIGDVYSSGKPEHKAHFRPISEWYSIGPVMGNFTCGSSFKPGCHNRSNDNLNGHRFMVLESDTLTRDEVGAIFRYINKRLNYELHCIIDTAGKSLHCWADVPKKKLHEARMKAALVALGCDPKVFTYSQPVRVPGALRDGKLQKLIWLNS